jgi:hypothetical protein
MGIGYACALFGSIQAGHNLGRQGFDPPFIPAFLDKSTNSILYMLALSKIKTLTIVLQFSEDI